MMSRKLFVFIAISIVVLAWLSYWVNFGFLLNLPVSDKPEEWGLLGDFLGGVLNPILTFLTIIILIQSLTIQKAETEKTKLFEKIRSFELHFFNMIDSQKALFSEFKIDVNIENRNIMKRGSRAVIEVENIVLMLKDSKKSTSEIKQAIEFFDTDDSIYSVTRTFSVIVKLINKKLTNGNGFTSTDRKEYYEILINYTDFALLRLILLSMKYLETEQLTQLRNNQEFLESLKATGIKSYLDDI